MSREYRPWTTRERDRARRMRADRLSWDNVGAALGRSPASCRAALRRIDAAKLPVDRDLERMKREGLRLVNGGMSYRESREVVGYPGAYQTWYTMLRRYRRRLAEGARS